MITRRSHPRVFHVALSTWAGDYFHKCFGAQYGIVATPQQPIMIGVALSPCDEMCRPSTHQTV